MTKVQIFQTKAGIYRSFQCKGHTEYTMEGEDIVCAAIGGDAQADRIISGGKR